ncbi:hypothetical protein [Parerythrobacter lacustris]|uniref:Uncharacterized protein n=1 Tax=Parerythrobacter lacustris TaxID=2969984 RepID=A0ABT1XQY0_9SPHN|nr:hypothetical protein [Parerythrobacter lacustris]MCR2833040.1 hypothetical protein [Parerythrobacter lacustris]
MKIPFVLLLAAATLCACTDEAVQVETTLEYVGNPKCWGGSTKVRNGYLILLYQKDEPYVYILSKNCIVKRYAGQGSAIEHIGVLEINGSSKAVDDQLGIDRPLGANYITSRKFPSLNTPVYEVQFALEERENNGFRYFRLSELKKLDRPPGKFEDLLAQ